MGEQRFKKFCHAREEWRNRSSRREQYGGTAKAGPWSWAGRLAREPVAPPQGPHQPTLSPTLNLHATTVLFPYRGLRGHAAAVCRLALPRSFLCIVRICSFST